MSSPNWIDRPEALAAGIARWRAQGVVGIDTEFVFERTFYPRLGLIQLATSAGRDGNEIALVDTVRIADLSPLAALLEADDVRKVIHSGSGDIPILRQATGAAPRPLFDTQIAAAYCGLGISISYGALIRELFGVELPKDETRTDWMRRPLSAAQQRYAAEDVAQLLAAAAELERRLRELGRLAWALEDSAALIEASREPANPQLAWQRVRGLDRLPPGPRAVARALAAWREGEAERLDLARSFLLRDETLLALARRGAAEPQPLAKLPGYDARRHAMHTTRWTEALAQAHRDIEAGAAPPEPEAQRLTTAARERRRTLEEAISAFVARRAGELGLPPELLLSRRQRDRVLSAWNGKGLLSAALDGYRADLLGPDLDRLAAASTQAPVTTGGRQ
ncbi:MAG: ribonuclease D [Thermoanaerobaculia bacterium]